MLVCVVELWRSISAGPSSIALHIGIFMFQQLRGRNVCPETPFLCKLDQLSVMYIGLLPLLTATQSRLKPLRYGRLALLCSLGGFKSWYMAIRDNFYCFLFKGHHPQAYIYVMTTE